MPDNLMVRTSRRIALGLALGLLLGTNLAQADVVPPPPTNCTPGSKGIITHGAAFCRALSCENVCPKGYSCSERSLCVAMRPAAARGKGDDREPRSEEEVVEECSLSQTCSRGTCKAMRVCVPDILPAEAGVEGGLGASGNRSSCRCELQTGQEASEWPWALLLAGVWWRRRTVYGKG